MSAWYGQAKLMFDQARFQDAYENIAQASYIAPKSTEVSLLKMQILSGLDEWGKLLELTESLMENPDLLSSSVTFRLAALGWLDRIEDAARLIDRFSDS